MLKIANIIMGGNLSDINEGVVHVNMNPADGYNMAGIGKK
jgi:hypothetical protein